jgi:hypothetical protein
MTGTDVDAGRAHADTKATGRSIDERRARIGWGRALGTGVAIMLCSFMAVVWVPDLILQLSALGRDTRVLVAATVSVLAVLLAAFVLRRLQARGII